MKIIWNALQTYGYLLMVSDGSVRYISSMLFGWILATPDGLWLAAANGPSIGRGSSLCTKGNRMLSSALFLSLIADESPSKQCTIKYISDNFGLIQQNTKHLEYDVPYPNTTIQPEFEIIKQIYCINKLHKIKSSFHWVKGHQDQTTNEEDLSIKSQLNISADLYTTDWQDAHVGASFPIPHEYPSSQAKMIIKNQAVTSNYQHQLICAYTESRDLKFLQEKWME